jgi:osmotically-inducible protein OsmY
MVRSDSEKKRILIEHLMWDDSIHSQNIQVVVEGNVAKLQGSVPNYAVKLAAERLALLVDGINKVENYLNIQFPPETSNIPDEEIGQHIINVLNSDSRFNSDKVIVSVDRGMVNLKGTVNSLWAKRTIGEICNTVNGVLDVENQLEIGIDNIRKDEEIHADIQNAFTRSMLFDENKIFIDVADGIVNLTGVLPNTIARREAYNIALYTTGVRDVVNSITIGRSL